MDEIYVDQDAPKLASVDERKWAVVESTRAAIDAGQPLPELSQEEQSAYDAIDLRDHAHQLYRPAIKRLAVGLVEEDRAYLLSLPELDDRVRDILENKL
jgi:hypothetical protein